MKKTLLFLIYIFSDILFAQENPWDYIYCQIVQQDTVWVGSKAGLSKLNLNTEDYEIYCSSNSALPSDFIYEIFIDKYNTKWLGTYGGGLVKMDSTNWHIYNTSNSILPSNAIFAIESDSSDTLWIGTNNGLVKFYQGNGTVFNSDNSPLPHNLIFDITIENDSIMWIATHLGLAKLCNNKWTIFNRYNSGLPKSKVYTVATTNGTLWAGTPNGLCSFDGNHWITHIPNNVIRIVYDDSTGNIWAGTNIGVKRNNIDWITYNSQNTILTENYIQSLFIEKKHTVWIGTWGGGLYRYTYKNLNDNWKKYEIYPTSISEGSEIKKPLRSFLYKIYPNPFNTVTNIEYQINKPTNVLLEIYNINGKLVYYHNEGNKNSGNYSIKWNGKNQFGKLLPSGLYICKLTIHQDVKFHKMLLVK